MYLKDIDKITEIYYAGHGGRIAMHRKKRNDNFKNKLRMNQKKGLIEKFAYGTEDKKQFLKYEVKDANLWNSLQVRYSVKRNPRLVIRTFFNLYLQYYSISFYVIILTGFLHSII